MARKTATRNLMFSGGALLTASLISFTAVADMRPIQIQRSQLVQPGQAELFGSLAYEISREPFIGGEQRDYDNLRVGPLGMRFGLTQGVEVGGHLTFNSNSGDSSDDPDDSGLEALTGFAKFALMQGMAVEGGIRVAGDDDVGPYPQDGIDFYINLSGEQRITDRGMIYGEFGLTVQDNDGGGGTYENWGLGYAHRLNTDVTLNAELVGDAAPSVYGAGNHMDLVLGANINVQQSMIFKPFVSVGIYDASPDFALGVGFDIPL
ncbi:MAG: hypothetical protein JJU06_14675 [Ectothiorhodospiraceae bacterium]|nr:hypothetical protein [Ectothiorhodospiraceae bacterium]